MKEHISSLVDMIVKKYNSNNPFFIANDLNISILYHSLPENLNAYIIQDLIVFNESLDECEMKYILAHELGHYFLHKNLSIGQYYKNHLLVKGKREREANIFAAELLLYYADEFSIAELSLEQLAAKYKLPAELLEFKTFNNNHIRRISHDSCNIL